jgi:hypothetical protein
VVIWVVRMALCCFAVAIACAWALAVGAAIDGVWLAEVFIVPVNVAWTGFFVVMARDLWHP